MTEAADNFKVRSFGDDLWSVVDLGNRFAQGMYIYGTGAALFKLSVTSLCIDVLSQDISGTPIHLRKWTPEGSVRVLPKDHPAAALLERPSRFFGRRQFFRMLTANLVTASEYYVAVNRNRAGEAIEMQGIRREQVASRVNPDSRRFFYDISVGSEAERALYGWTQKGVMSDRNVAHLIARSVNGIDVLSTDALARGATGLLNQMNDYQSGLFANGGMPVMAFKFPEGLTPEQFQRLENDLVRSTKIAREKGRPFILEGADGKVPEIEKISLSSVDTEFVKAHEAAGVEAARYFRMPPHKVYLLASVKYDNQEAAERTYVDDALGPIYDVIEEQLGGVLLTEDEQKEYFLAFDREMAYAQNPTERHKIANERWKTGQLTFDEMRQAIGMNAVGGDEGKVRMFSGNFVLVGEENEVIMRAGGNAPDDGKSEGEGGEKQPADDKKKSHLTVVQGSKP